jgi:hypothetical protein
MKLNLQPNPPAAVIISQRNYGAGLTGTEHCYIRGGAGTGAVWVSQSVPGSGQWAAGSLTTGAQSTQLNSGATLNVLQLFGVSPNDLRSMSDYTGDTVSDIPNPFPSGSMVYINGNAVFGSTCPLIGYGILVVNGNLTIPTGTDAFFSGLVHVTGNVNILGGATISGCLIVANNPAVAGSGTLTLANGTSTVTIQYDSDALAMVEKAAVKYRENRSVFQVFSAYK